MSAHRIARSVLAQAIFEHLLIIGAVLVSARLRLSTQRWASFTADNGYAKAWLIAAAVQLCLYFADLYDARACAELRRLFMRLVQGLAAATFCLAVVYFWFPALMIGRGVLLIASCLIVTIVGGWRVAERWIRGRTARERLLLVGTTPQVIALARELFERRAELGLEIVGFIDTEPSKIGTPVINPGVIGAIDDIPAIVDARKVSRVVVGLTDARGKPPMDKLLSMRLTGVRFDHLASVYEEYTGKIAIEILPSWFMFSSGFQKKQWLLGAKRLFDILTSAAGLLLGLPMMLVVAAAVKLTSKGPVLYHQTRLGRGGRPFVLHKFRSMRLDAEANTGAVWAAKVDTRVTPVGDFLRSTRLDEMPQLWNVLVGEMSLVGPRPERPEFVNDLTRQIPFYGERHIVKPGITGWAQVRYSYGASVEDALEKLRHDLFYVKNFSLTFDLLIVLSTVKTVLLRRGF